MKKKLAVLLIISIAVISLSGCGEKNSNTNSCTKSDVSTDIDTNKLDTEFTDNDLSSDYDSSTAVKTAENSDVITISDGKTYTVTGTHNQIVVEAGENDKPQIILENATLNSADGPAIYIKSADKVFITIPENTESNISDGESYTSYYENADGAIFSKADMTVNGKGKLNITGNYKCGIVSKDDLVITNTNITIKSTGNAVEGKDCVKLSGAKLTLDAGSDGIKSTNTEDTSLGFVYIESGNYTITAGNDGIQAESALLIDGGSFNITTGGGSAVASTGSNNNGWGNWGGRPGESYTNESADTESAKAIKCSTLIKINGGEFTIDSSDDSIHSNSDAQINGGSITAASGDDGVHADDQLIINDGTVTVTKSYEGIEATAITVTGGRLNITASDDGFNAAGGNDSSAMGGRLGQNSFESDSDAKIEISGGYILVDASGDGVDSNGDININGGVLLVSGPTNSGNGSLDFGGNAYINGGTAIFTGASGMAETFSENSKQVSVAYGLDSTQNSGTTVALSDSKGNVLASFLPSKTYSHVIISTPDMKKGAEYTISLGGSITDCDDNGYTDSGKVTNTTQSLEVEISSIATSYGSRGMGGGRPGGHGGDMGGGMIGGRFY